MTEKLLTAAEVAQILGVAPKTLANWRTMGRGPAWVRLTHSSVRYTEAQVAAWVAACSNDDDGENRKGCRCSDDTSTSASRC